MPNELENRSSYHLHFAIPGRKCKINMHQIVEVENNSPLYVYGKLTFDGIGRHFHSYDLRTALVKGGSIINHEFILKFETIYLIIEGCVSLSSRLINKRLKTDQLGVIFDRIIIK